MLFLGGGSGGSHARLDGGEVVLGVGAGGEDGGHAGAEVGVERGGDVVGGGGEPGEGPEEVAAFGELGDGVGPVGVEAWVGEVVEAGAEEVFCARAGLGQRGVFFFFFWWWWW